MLTLQFGPLLKGKAMLDVALNRQPRFLGKREVVNLASADGPR